MERPVFHVAFAVRDLEETRAFYKTILGCLEGRSAPTWIDFDLYGHQISAHLCPEETRRPATNNVDGDGVPVRHMGAILPWDEWHTLVARLKEHEVKFLIEPRIRFQGQVGEQATCFFLDPSGNALEFKSFRDMSQVFAVG